MVVKAALIQMKCGEDRDEIITRTLSYIDEAAAKGAKIVCLQELFNGIYFCQYMDSKYYDWAEPIPGPTTKIMQECAQKNGIVLIVPLYEMVFPGTYYNTAVVINKDGEILGRYRKNHIPELPLFHEKFYFKPGNLGYPVFRTEYGNIAVYICYDRHFPEGPRVFGLHGADLLFIPTATKGSYKYLWEVELRAHAIANGLWVGGVNRVGQEDQMDFYGSSFFTDPRGQIVAQTGDEGDAIVYADIDYTKNKEVRDLWQFYRDRRPETYLDMVRMMP
jgi:N-carbamoylputrescine amidase